MDQDLEKLFTNISNLHKLINQLSQKSIEEQQATLVQYSVLSKIKEKESISMGELSEALHMSLSSATQLVERLVKAGFVQRLPDSKDRRITNVMLTQQGELQYTTLKKEIVAHLESIFTNVPLNDRQELIRITDDLIYTLKQKV